jgi:hypothetical protein
MYSKLIVDLEMFTQKAHLIEKENVELIMNTKINLK